MNPSTFQDDSTGDREYWEHRLHELGFSPLQVHAAFIAFVFGSITAADSPPDPLRFEQVAEALRDSPMWAHTLDCLVEFVETALPAERRSDA